MPRGPKGTRPRSAASEVRRAGYGIAILLGLAAIFQLFFRYEYLAGGGVIFLRVDRLTLASCFMPCDRVRAVSQSSLIAPLPSPTPVIDIFKGIGPSP